MKKIFAFAGLAVATFAGAAFAAEGYSLSVRGGSGKVNTPITSTIVVTSTGDHHINKEYPHKVLLTAPDGVTVESAKVMGVVASETTLTFTVVSTVAAAGTKGIGGEVKFATCTASSCLPAAEKVTINVKAE